MKFKDLYDLTLREVLENYAVLCNLECGYHYGIASIEDIEEMFGNWNVEEYSEAMSVEPLISYDVAMSDDDELVTYDKMCRICDNLGISKRKD